MPSGTKSWNTCPPRAQSGSDLELLPKIPVCASSQCYPHALLGVQQDPTTEPAHHLAQWWLLLEEAFLVVTHQMVLGEDKWVEMPSEDLKR